ncbi:LETM1-related biofilm-associated protein [Flavobacterium sp. J27]|uniref:LETM1-related biofilm-associated protein n=1 Tax=Flavobacterium sp. J27 TaxID=2060419 RepID=UPI00102FE1C9|nr:LETM1-related biofilm-associated protein [Flavobacterium sp. J27]
MINPSINGWIDKFFLENQSNFKDYSDYESFYTDLRKSGFIYGHPITIVLKNSIDLSGLSLDEITKIAFLNTLYTVFCIKTKETDTLLFLKSVNSFYKSIQKENYNFLTKLLPSASKSSQLESIINDRIQTNQNVVTKSFSHIVINAMLFLDVLGYYQYIHQEDHTEKYLKDFESSCMKVVSLTFKIKNNKTKYDELLIKLFENSLRYSKLQNIDTLTIEEINFTKFQTLIEKLYILDLVEMAVWSDTKLDIKELNFLEIIIEKLQLNILFLNESLFTIEDFIMTNKDEISYFNFSNPVKHFYDQTNKTVSKLINRNKKRLIKEISESKELMVLLAKSTTKELDKDEKKKVKKQLLDICKTIPSLTIFLLPGGGILLPILVKYIPQLLPSAFNENLEED